MPGLLQIRNVPDDVRRALTARAAARGESLNAHLLDLLNPGRYPGRRSRRCSTARPAAANEPRCPRSTCWPTREPTATVGDEALGAAPGTETLRARGSPRRTCTRRRGVDDEVVSALRGLTLGGHLSTARAQDLLTDLDDLPLQRWAPADALRRRAFQLRNAVSPYDAAYVALAEALGCPLVTRDGRLARSNGHQAALEVP